MQQILLGNLPKLVDGITGNIVSYALILAAVATVTMTFLELVKAVFKLRYYYHRDKVKAWLSDTTCFNQLLALTVTDQDAQEALFDQPTDKLMAQVQAAVNVVIDFPDTYPEFYKFFTQVPVPFADGQSDSEVWKTFITSSYAGEPAGPADPLVQAATRARARIDHFVSRKLDAFQTRTEFLWARKNQYYSVFASFVFLVALLVYICVPILWAVILAGFGGMMAPFAKDIVTALSGLRTK